MPASTFTTNAGDGGRSELVDAYYAPPCRFARKRAD
jgi:hypothetical protein